MQRNSKENHSTTADAYRFAEFELIPSERQLRRRGKPVALPPKTFDALLILVRNAERLVRRDELIERLWPDTYVTDTNLTNTIVALRKVIGRDAIQTVSKFGYRFCLPVIGEPGIPAPTYASFLEAKALAAVRSLESMARARDLFAVCVAQDPTFAAAWVAGEMCAVPGEIHRRVRCEPRPRPRGVSAGAGDRSTPGLRAPFLHTASDRPRPVSGGGGPAR